MQPNEYQKLAGRTLIDKPDGEYTYHQIEAILSAIDLFVEVGKHIDYLKKGIFHQHGVKQAVVQEQIENIEWKYSTLANGISTINEQSERKHHLTPQQIMLLWNLTGVGGESSEFIEYIVNCINENTPIDRDIVTKEAGDMEWYTNASLTKLGINFEDVLIANIEKLEKRYPNGYSSEASKVKGELL